MRAISTVLDVTLCLLLVSASALVLVGANSPRPPSEASAEPTANVLETSTANVNYTIPSDSGNLHRTTHGTLAGLLGQAALANATVRGVEPSRASDPFERVVRRRVRERLDYPENVQILVRWRPYRGAHLDGRFAVGDSPPSSADVHAAVRSIPSGLPPVRGSAVRAARRSGYHGVARVVAAGIVAGLVPRRTTTLALHDRETGTIVAERLRRLIRAYGATELASARLDSERTRAALVQAVTSAIESDLRSTFETPTAAARSVSVGRTRLVVRTWSA